MATRIPPTRGAPRKTDLLPLSIAPQLATLVDAPPRTGEWAFELKFDGYRLAARVDRQEVKLFTRNGHDWTSKLPHLQKAIQRLELGTAWLDGEIVIVGATGRSEFQALQNAFDRRGAKEAIQYYAFDLLFFNGHDLRDQPLSVRREKLQALLMDAPAPLHFSASFGNDGLRVLQAVADLGGEGVVGKRVDAKYTSGRSTSWIKLKTTQRQEFVVVGYTDPRGTRTGLGALVLAVNDAAGRLIYAGTVGSGFSESGIKQLLKRLEPLKREDAPLEVPRGVRAQWLNPTLVAEVAFTEWTRDGSVRHPVFKGLREDKEPNRVTREVPVHLLPPKPAGSSDVKVTHGDRVIDSTTGLTKAHLVDYYRSAADLLLRYIKGRPVALVRAPSGIGGTTFFQKQPETLKFSGLNAVLDGDSQLICFSTSAAIMQAAQLNVIEFHPWNAMTRGLEKPDRVIFDLDPGEGVAFEKVREAAVLVRTLLEELDLQCFLKTSGGKGLHVVVPVTPRLGWDDLGDFSAAVVRHLERLAPRRFVSKFGAHNRVGKILIDVGRNTRGSTTAAAYSARARPGLGVSIPLAWHELDSVNAGSQWTIGNAHGRLEASERAWEAFWTTRQALSKANLKRLARPG